MLHLKAQGFIESIANESNASNYDVELPQKIRGKRVKPQGARPRPTPLAER